MTRERAPRRVQRRRERGWRMPEGAVYVGRPSRWGNPYRVVKCRDGIGDEAAQVFRETAPRALMGMFFLKHDRSAYAVAAEYAVEQYVAHVVPCLDLARVRSELAGRDLVCWCPLDSPCHADVLLEIANPRRLRRER